MLPAISDAPARPAPARLGWLDAARGISILLIVLMHARVVLGGVGVHSELIADLDDVAGHLRIPLFFAASGLFAARWARASWRELFTGRLVLLMWVFVVWQPVVLAYKLAEWWLLRDQLDAAWGWQVAQFVLSPVRPVGELWFLWALGVFLVLAKLLARVPVALRVGIPAVVSFVWMSTVEPSMTLEFSTVTGSGWGGIAKYFVFFIAASAFSGRIRSLVSAMPLWTALGIVAVWAALTVAAIESDLDVRWVRFGLCALGAVAGFALGRLLAPIASLRRLGRSTLPVYVAHLPIIVLVVIVATMIGALPVLAVAPSATVIALAALAVAGATATHRMLNRSAHGAIMYAPPAWFARLATSRSARARSR